VKKQRNPVGLVDCHNDMIFRFIASSIARDSLEPKSHENHKGFPMRQSLVAMGACLIGLLASVPKAGRALFWPMGVACSPTSQPLIRRRGWPSQAA